MERLKVPLVLGVAALAVGFLVLRGATRNDVYMTSLDELDAERASRERVRVMGWIDEGSIREADRELVTDFAMRNETGTRVQPVRYRGVVPDLFRDGASVQAAGRIGEDGVFHADELMTRCPSKYEAVEAPVAESEPPAGAGGELDA